MNWISLGIVVTLDSVVIFVHTLSLALLVRLKQNNVKGSQKMLLIALCATRLIYALLDILEHTCIKLELDHRTIVFYVINSTTVTSMYIFIITCIVVDRFLEIYLNIKYNVLWFSKKTKILLFLGLAICCLLFIPFIMIALNNIFHAEDIVYRYIYPVFEIIFIIIFLCSYFYLYLYLYFIYIYIYLYFYLYFIYILFIYRRNTKKLEKQLSRNSKVVHHKQSNNLFKLFLPTSIIVTFLLFILRLCVSLEFLCDDVGYSISFVFIPIGFIADCIIYVFSLKANRLAFSRILSCNNYVHTTDSVCL